MRRGRRFVDGFVPDRFLDARRFVVVSTQGKGDEAALKAALSIEADYRGFVGSRRKMASLREKLLAQGFAPQPSTVSKRRPASISAPSRRKRSRCRFWRRSSQRRRDGQRNATSQSQAAKA